LPLFAPSSIHTTSIVMKRESNGCEDWGLKGANLLSPAPCGPKLQQPLLAVLRLAVGA
jgi:hypothetical protein